MQAFSSAIETVLVYKSGTSFPVERTLFKDINELMKN